MHNHPEKAKKPSMEDIVDVRFAVPSKMAVTVGDEIIVATCAESVLRIPKSLLKGSTGTHLRFEARVPRDVAAAMRSLIGEFHRMHKMIQPMPTTT
jgi:hypothetical protein